MLANYEKKAKKIQDEIINVGEEIINSNSLILDYLGSCEDSCDVTTIAKSRKMLETLNVKLDKVDNDIVSLLALHSPEASDLRLMIAYLKVTNELSKAITNTRRLSKGLIEASELIVSNNLVNDTIAMHKSALKSLQKSVKMLKVDASDEVQEIYDSIVVLDSKTDDAYDVLESKLSKACQKVDSFNTYHLVLKSLRKSSKISDRALSIASLLLFANNGGRIVHI